MPEFDFDNQLDPCMEIKYLLDFNQLKYTFENGIFIMSFMQEDFKWNTYIKTDSMTVHIYGTYKIYISDRSELLEALNRLNASIKAGCFYLDGNFIVHHTTVELYDVYYSTEAIASAIEENSSAVFYSHGKLRGSGV